MKKAFLLILLLPAIHGCQEPVSLTTGTGNTAAVITGPPFKKLTIDKELYAATTELVPLDEVYAVKDTLHIITKKIQACKAENFKLMWNGAMMKSLPPQTNLRLFQLTDATCNEKHKFHLTFNITPTRFKRDSSSTILHLGGWREAINYQF